MNPSKFRKSKDRNPSEKKQKILEENSNEIITCGEPNNHNIFEITKEQLQDAVRRAHDKSNPDSNNGLITKIWGPPTWETFFSILFGYPIEPTEEQKIDYLFFLTLLGKVLPCIFCRKSYSEFISKDGDCPLTMETMKSRYTLTMWGFCIHNRVNKKLGVDYGVTYEEVCYKYESYRAKCTKTEKGCVMPLSMKSKSYQNADIKRAPIVSYEYCKAFIPHAMTLGLYNYEPMLEKTRGIERNSESWMLRDILCVKVTKHMRLNGISSLDDHGLPSVHEMILLSLMSTTLEESKIKEIIKTLRSDSDEVYKE